MSRTQLSTHTNPLIRMAARTRLSPASSRATLSGAFELLENILPALPHQLLLLLQKLHRGY